MEFLHKKLLKNMIVFGIVISLVLSGDSSLAAVLASESVAEVSQEEVQEAAPEAVQEPQQETAAQTENLEEQAAEPVEELQVTDCSEETSDAVEEHLETEALQTSDVPEATEPIATETASEMEHTETIETIVEEDMQDDLATETEELLEDATEVIEEAEIPVFSTHVKLHWKDNGNAEGRRQSQIIVYANGEKMHPQPSVTMLGKSVNGDTDTETYQIADLPEYRLVNGDRDQKEAIIYSVSVKAPAGYRNLGSYHGSGEKANVAKDGSQDYGFSLPTYAVSGTVIWEDDEDINGMRPTADTYFTDIFKVSGSQGYSLSYEEDGKEWRFQITGLPANDTSDNSAVYYIGDTAPDGYLSNHENILVNKDSNDLEIIYTAQAIPMTLLIADNLQMGLSNEDVFELNFYVDGEQIDTQWVAGGETADRPANPAIPSAYNVFTGWYQTGESEPFDFAQPITTDIDLTAAFAKEYTIQFENGVGVIVKSVRTDETGLQSEPAVNMASLNGMVYSGTWYIKEDSEKYILEDGTQTATEFVFGTSIDRDIRLIPGVKEQYVVQFVTYGSLVEPQILSYGECANDPGEVTRAGYTFMGWSLTDPASLKAGESASPYAFTDTVTGDLTIYAVWAPKVVTYQINYWLETANIAIDEMDPEDPGMYSLAYSEERSAEAGSKVKIEESDVPKLESFKMALALAPTTNVDRSIAPYSEYYKSTEEVINGDGSTIINVYYTRKIYNMVYEVGTIPAKSKDATPASVKVWVNGVAYTEPTYTVQGKLGLYVDNPLPVDDDGTVYFLAYDGEGNELTQYTMRGWGKNAFSTTRYGISEAILSTDGLYGYRYDAKEGNVYYAPLWVTTNQTKTRYHIYVESLDQTSGGATNPVDSSGEAVPRLEINQLFYMKLVDPVKIDQSINKFDLNYTSNYYWASDYDRQIMNGYTGFTLYSKATTGNSANCYQWNESKGFYQLIAGDKNNSNDEHRYFIYKRNEYSLKFNAMGKADNQTIDHIKYESDISGQKAVGDTVVSQMNLRSNERFVGWYRDSEYTIPFSFTDATMPANNVELFAKIAVEDYTVTFLEEKGGQELWQEMVAEGESVSEPSEYVIGKSYQFGKSGEMRIFRGWYWEYQGAELSYHFGTAIQDNLTIYAKWDDGVHTVTYDLNSSDAGQQVPVDVNEYAAFTDVSVSTESGYTNGSRIFVGWKIATKNAGYDNNKLYYPGSAFKIYSDVTLVAQYVPPAEAVTLTYEPNGGTGSAKTYHFAINQPLQILSIENLDFSRKGYTFKGWSENPNDHIVSCSEGMQLRLQENKVLYAVWESVQVTVIYDKNAGDGLKRDFNYDQYDEVAIKAETDSELDFSRDGYTFMGWSLAADSDIIAYQPGDVIPELEADLHLFAQWNNDSEEESTEEETTEETGSGGGSNGGSDSNAGGGTTPTENSGVLGAIRELIDQAAEEGVLGARVAQGVLGAMRPQTGDTASTVLWSVLLLGAAAALVFVFLKRRKDKI